MKVVRTSLYLQSRRERLLEEIDVAENHQKAYVEWRNIYVTKLKDCQSTSSNEKVKKQEDQLERGRLAIVKVGERMKDLQTKMDELELQSRALKDEEEAVEKGWRQFTAAKTEQSKLDRYPNIRQFPILRQLRLPKLFSTKEGYVAPRFKVQPPRKVPRPQQDIAMEDIQLENESDSELPQ